MYIYIYYIYINIQSQALIFQADPSPIVFTFNSNSQIQDNYRIDSVVSYEFSNNNFSDYYFNLTSSLNSTGLFS